MGPIRQIWPFLAFLDVIYPEYNIVHVRGGREWKPSVFHEFV